MILTRRNILAGEEVPPIGSRGCGALAQGRFDLGILSDPMELKPGAERS
jgi:hypothetical protein